MILEDPKPSSSPTVLAPDSSPSAASPARLSAAGGIASQSPATRLSSSTPLLGAHSFVGDGQPDELLEAPPPYLEDLKAPSSATRRACQRLIHASLVALALYALLGAGGLLGWALARSGRPLSHGRPPPGRGGDDGPPPFGPNSPLHQPFPPSAHRWNQTQGALPSSDHGVPLYCNPVSATPHPTSHPASVFLVPITTDLIGVRFYDTAALAADPSLLSADERPRDISSQSSITFLPWTDGLEEDGWAIKIVVEGILSADAKSANHQVCLTQAGGPQRDDERSPKGLARPPSDHEDEALVEGWLVDIFVSDLADPPTVKVTVYVPPTPLDAPPRNRPQYYVGHMSGELAIGDLGRVGDGYEPFVFRSFLVSGQDGVPSRKIDIESLAAEKIIILSTAAVGNVRLGNLTVSEEAWVTLEDSSANIEGHFSVSQGASINLFTPSGRIDASVVVPVQAANAAKASASPQSLPSSLDAVEVNARTVYGHLAVHVPFADARVPLVVNAVTTHGVADVTLPSTFQGRIGLSSSTYRTPVLHFPTTADQSPDPFGLEPARAFFCSMGFTGRFGIAGTVGWAVPGTPKRVDPGWEVAKVEVLVKDGGSGRCELTLLGQSGDPDPGHHDVRE